MKTTLKIYNYKKGGSMICCEEKFEFDDIPSSEIIQQKIKQHKEKHNWEYAFFVLKG